MVNLDELKNLCRNITEEDVSENENVVSQLIANKAFLVLVKSFMEEYEGIYSEFLAELDTFDITTRNKLLILTGLRGNMKAFEVIFNIINNLIPGEEKND